MPLPRLVKAAARRLSDYGLETPLVPSWPLSRLTGAQVFLKLECLQRTGSFKVRGALNKVLTLTAEERRRGVIAASTGNHGLAVTHAMLVAGVRGLVYLPRTAASHKLAALRQAGAPIAFHGSDCEQTERFARSAAAEAGQTFISPYNDLEVVAGQGTIAVETVRQLGTPPDLLFTSVGGGGLMAGTGSYLRSQSRLTKLIGCWPQHSPALYECLRAGRIVPCEFEPTLSDATAGGVEPGAVTFELCRNLIDDYRLVDEDAIREAIGLMLHEHGLVVEGAAAVAVAGLLERPDELDGKVAVVVLCGRNIGRDDLRGCC